MKMVQGTSKAAGPPTIDNAPSDNRQGSPVGIRLLTRLLCMDSRQVKHLKALPRTRCNQVTGLPGIDFGRVLRREDQDQQEKPQVNQLLRLYMAESVRGVTSIVV